MSVMKIACIIKSIVVWALAGSAIAATAPNELEQARTLASQAEKDIFAISNYIANEKVPSFSIYSQWYVDRLAKKDPIRGELEQARRDFGTKLITTLEAWAKNETLPVTSQEREKQALALLYLSEWIGQKPGYGNALLFVRTQDLASVPIGHLIADLSYPESKLPPLVDRLLYEADATDILIRSLNVESGEHRFTLPVPCPSVAGIFDSEKRGKIYFAKKEQSNFIWHKNMRRIMQIWESRPDWKKHNGYFSPDISWKIRDELPEDLQFFADDEHPQGMEAGMGIDYMWPRKFHKQLLLGFQLRAAAIKGFLLFRQCVKKFPTTPPPSWYPGKDNIIDTPIKAAFEVAWRPFAKGEFLNYHACGYAARCYEAIRDNKFYDYGTQRRMENEHFFQAQAKAKAEAEVQANRQK